MQYLHCNLTCRRGNMHFHAHLRQNRPVPFLLSEDIKLPPMRMGKVGKVFISRQSWHFGFVKNMNKVIFSNLYFEVV